ncbi:MAG TPA: hypothetical protein VIO11_02280 [Candidatus Methanoperedens sp.]
MKAMLVLFAFAGVALWYIPNSISIFSGQHNYYQLDDNMSQIPCTKCHGDISMEVHTGFIHNNFTCSDCHRVQKSVQYANATTPGTLAHAASIVRCEDCHSEYLNNTPDSIHEAFIRYGMEHNTSDNCIACHTSIAVSINWTRPDTRVIETISNGQIINVSRTYRSNMTGVETFGNTSGDVFAVSNVRVI